MNKRLVLCLAGSCIMLGNVLGQIPGNVNLVPPDQEGALPVDLMRMSQDELMINANRLLQQGETNAALSLLTLCHDRSLQEHAGRATLLLNALLDAGNLPEAERIYQENQAQRDRLLRDYIALVYQYYVRQGDKQALLAWVAGLQTRPLPQDMRVQTFGWQVDVSRELGPLSRVMALVPVCISSFDASTSRSILSGIINSYESTGDGAAVEGLLNAVDRDAGKTPELRQMVTAMRVNRLFASAHWAKAEAKFMKEAPGLPDAELLACFQYAKPRLIDAKKSELLDRLCAWVLKEQKDKPRLWQAAAQAWIENAKATKPVAELSVRLAALERMGGDPHIVLGLYYLYSDPIMKNNNTESMRAMIKTGESLLKQLKQKQDIDLCKCKIAEYYFLLQDYDSTLRLFKDPLTTMEPKEQENVVNKIKAHQAWKKGNKKDAIKYFRAFMENVKLWTGPENSIFLDIVFSREMCLGLSAKRIGDIYASLDDSAKAQAAYKEADGYYVIAEKEFLEKPKESEYIKKCRAELAKLMKK